MCGYMCLPTHHASIQLSQGKGDYGACQRAVRYGLTDLTLLHLAPRRIGRYGESFRVCCGYRRGHFGIDEDSGGQIDTHKLEQHNSIMLKPRCCQLADANRICGLDTLLRSFSQLLRCWFFANDMYYPSPNLDIQTRSTVQYLIFCQTLILVCKYHL